MKHTIPYRMVDSHIIVISEDGKIYLIDTVGAIALPYILKKKSRKTATLSIH
jgi:hypothetical protein